MCVYLFFQGVKLHFTLFWHRFNPNSIKGGGGHTMITLREEKIIPVLYCLSKV